MVKLYRSMLLLSEPHVIAAIAFIRANWSACKASGEPLCVEITQKGSKRSTEQNRRFHALLNCISEHAWVNGKQFDSETWKEFARRKWIGMEEINLPDGTRVERGISTTTLSVSEFADLMTKLESYAAEELGVILE
jgi:hypothetical protein